MQLDPQARTVLDELTAKTQAAAQAAALRSAGGDWIQLYREQLLIFRDFGGTPEPCSTEDVSCTGTSGEVRIRLYRPDSPRATARPALLFIHGGGFIGGSFETHELPLRALAHRSGCLIAAVDYRLAPEHPWPAAPEDCYAALTFLYENAGELGLDPQRLVVAGDSAGGLLAAAVAILARDRKGPLLRLHAALYPNMDLREDREYPSMASHDGTIVKLDELHRGLRLYLPIGVDRTAPTVSPALARDLSGLPAVLVITCECDPLRDEGEAYVAGLRSARVPVTHARYSGMIHGFLQMAGRVEAGRTLINQLAATLGLLALD